MNARASAIHKWLFFIFFTGLESISFAQLKADFSATGATGCAPIVVKFTDLSKGNPTKWKWDLGNGTISFLRNPSLTYFSPGQYTVKLTISNASGSDSVTKTRFITVYDKPVAAFAASDTTGCFPLQVLFTDMSTPVNGELSKWQWDFGDGTSSTLANPTHIYTSAGRFNVSLRVTNSFGCVRSLTKQQYIQITTGVLADFSVKMSNSCKAPALINFTNNSKVSGDVSYQWDFGDGNGSTLASPSHTYTSDGNYTVKLVVRNATGCSDTLVKINSIILGNTNADFAISPSVCRNSYIKITNTSKPLPATMLWTFGDGTTSRDTTPVKRYAETGNYVIKMVANFGACLDSVSKPVVVMDIPRGDFITDDSVSCKVPFAARFTANVQGAIAYSWDFGDGTRSSDKNPVHTYTRAGVYDVRLVATNASGCSDSLVKTGYIRIRLPEATILNLPAKGCAPFTFDFASNIVSTEPVAKYEWDFGDGSASSITRPSHTYVLPGNYTVSVRITTTGGCTDTVTAVEGVNVGTRPVAKFSGVPVNTCAYVPVVFTDLSTGKVDRWYWDFGDGSNSIEQNPKHLYEDTGYFTVTLVALSNGCADTARVARYIHISPPVARFLVNFDCKIPKQRTFTDMSVGADTWSWDFGDGSVSAVQNPVHTYASAGNYVIKLTVTNLANGCSFTKSQSISVIAEKANFSASDSLICKGTAITFKSLNINGASIASYWWNFGDGPTLSSPGPVTHIYSLAGTYTVSLAITDFLGCTDTMVKPMYIHVEGPTAMFRASVPGTCLNNDISFVDSSYSDGINPIRQWTWDYGDGKSETLGGPPFRHRYSSPGIYTVKLKITDAKGCADSLTKVDLLVISQPLAAFNTQDSVMCPQGPVNFINGSTGPGLAYLWNFGDGATSSEVNPVHQYASTGAYPITLVVTDTFGCTDSLTKSGFIKIVIPVADFSMSDSIGNCPPLVVDFTNKSSNNINSLWDFGDGSTSQENNPSHFYSIPGSYTVTLRVTAPGGCADEKSRQIIIKGPYGSFSYKNITGCNPLKTNFSSSTTNTTSLIWDFNDGTTVATTDSVLSHEYTNPGIYLPKIILMDATGCRVPITGTDTVVVYEVRSDFSSDITTVCDSGIVRFNDRTISNDLITSYAWDFGDGHVSNQQNPENIYSSTGTYPVKLVVISQFGCIDSSIASSPVKVVNRPKIAITGGRGACVPAALNFSADILVADTSALLWMWDFGNGNSSVLKNPPTQIYSLANSYEIKLTGTNSSGCSTTVTKTIQAFPLPKVKINGSPYLCNGNTSNISVSGASSYVWTPATGLSCTDCANPVAKPDSSVTYFVTGTSKDGCTTADSLSISVKYAFRVNVSKKDSLCMGSSAILFAEGGDRFVWSPPTGLSDPYVARPTATPLQSVTYQVIASDEANCFRDTGYVPIEVFPVPTVNAGEDKTVNVGKTVELIPVISADVSSVNWSPTSGIFRNNYPGISVKPSESLEYTVEVANVGGCMARDKVTVYVLCNDANIFIPNTFSPNQDGANDIFYPRGTGVFQIKMLRVFSRWGEVVFEKSNFQANDISAGWNGTFKGRQLPADVFVYTMLVVCDNNTVLTYKGNISLIR